MNLTKAVSATTGEALRALTRTDIVLCAVPISLFLSIVSLLV